MSEPRRGAYRTEVPTSLIHELAIWFVANLAPGKEFDPSTLGSPLLRLTETEKYRISLEDISALGCRLSIRNKTGWTKPPEAFANLPALIFVSLEHPRYREMLKLLLHGRVARAEQLDAATYSLGFSFLARGRYLEGSGRVSLVHLKERGLDKLAGWVHQLGEVVEEDTPANEYLAWFEDLD